MIHLRCLVVFTLLAAAACDTPQDQTRLQDETLATASRYDARFDELRRRAEDVDRERGALPRELASASIEHLLSQARSQIEDSRGYLKGVRARVTTRPGSAAELRAQLDEMRERLDRSVTEAGWDIETAESQVWVAAKQGGIVVARQGAPPAAEPAPPAGERAPQTDASGAPIR